MGTTRTPRSTWKGLLRFSLVSIPVRLYSAEETGSKIAFHWYHTCHPNQPELGNRIENHKYCTVCAREVPAGEIHRGYEHERGKHVVITDADLDAVAAQASSDIDIETVTNEPINPVFIESTLMLVPEASHAQDFETIRQALAQRIAIGTIVLREKTWRVALQAEETGMVLYRLRAQSQVRAWSDVMPPIEALPPDPRAVKVARKLLNNMVGSFQYADVRDDRNERLIEIIEAKKSGTALTILPAKPSGKALSLMDALSQSLRKEAAKKITPGAANQLKVETTTKKSTKRKSA